MHSVNIIVINDTDIQSVTTFPCSPKGRQAAKDLFRDLILADLDNEYDWEYHLKDGKYQRDHYLVYFCNGESVDTL